MRRSERQAELKRLAEQSYGKLEGEWQEWLGVAKRYEYKVPSQDRLDIRHDIMLELHRARQRDNKPLPLLRAYRIASLVVALYWRQVKRLPTILSLDEPTTYANDILLRDAVADDSAIDLEAWQDAEAFLLGCPMRLIMVGAAARGLPICILHDYDINGLLIHDTLLEPTKRRDSFIEGETHDLGFTYEQLKTLMKRPEPVELKAGDRGKLRGLLADAKVSSEEYEFLLRYRVELNALTPLELLRWLEAELEQRDLWKTIPDEAQLRDEAERQIRAELTDYRGGLASDVTDSMFEELGLDKVRELIDEIESYAQDRAMEEIDWPYVESEASVDELVERLKKRPENYWKHTARVMGLEESAPFKDKMDSLVDEGKEQWAQEITRQEPVQDKLGEIREALG